MKMYNMRCTNTWAFFAIFCAMSFMSNDACAHPTSSNSEARQPIIYIGLPPGESPSVQLPPGLMIDPDYEQEYNTGPRNMFRWG
ncbi:hypothetical protein CRM22_006004 [Opisthorchis felineus]|uniref:Secreted protein n=1 Tax=Opisthorchis felineus TaxID=147828 RepID=A0A4S2LPT5_OPIFE|nr:hypothetical protein CRM22_006004 [Opisthorchis felineus]